MSFSASPQSASDVNLRDARIDVLRAIAAFSVLVFHAHNSWYLGVGGEVAATDQLRLRDTWIGLASSPITLGFLGLNLFFVLSGLCIHSWYINHTTVRQEAFSYRAYMSRRFWRIYPAYAAAVVISLCCLAIAEWIRADRYGLSEPSIYASQWLWQTLRYLTFTHTLSIDTFGGYNAPLYTMAIEMHFYIAYPVVLFCFRRLGPERTLLLSVALSVACSAVAVASGDATVKRLVLDSFLVRWPEWIMGCVIAEILFRARRGEQVRTSTASIYAASATCFLLALVIQLASGISPNLLWSGSIALLVPAYLLGRRGSAVRWESSLAGIGLFSYSIYLLHYPILRIVALLMPPQNDVLAAQAVVYIFVIVLIMLFASAFFRLFEKPFLASRRR